MHGLGNDFVIIDARDGGFSLDNVDITKVCDRHFGIGCDQFILIEPSEHADVFMRIYNPDGTESGACGNATRCVAALVMAELGTDACTVETLRGVLPCRRADDLVQVDMGAPVSHGPAEFFNDTLGAPYLVDMGNPHCVFFVTDIESLDITTFGPQYEYHKAFPDRANIEFVQVLADGGLRTRVWERGAGVTLACGSGACAVAVAAAAQGHAGRSSRVIMDGGELHLEWREEDDHVLMTGSVTYVFKGAFESTDQV